MTNDGIIFKRNLAVHKKKHCFKTNPAKANCVFKEKLISRDEESGLFINGERTQLLPLFAETTSNRISEKWNELTDERAIVLKFYREEGESGTLNEEREANWWTKSAVRRLKSSVTTPDRPTNQVPSEHSARMKGKETEQKIPNQSVFRNTLNVSNIDTSLT